MHELDPKPATGSSNQAGKAHPAALAETELLKHVAVSRGRAGGPGGQNRNKVETKITVLHEPTGIEAHASERRSAEENRKVAMRRLRLALATQVRLVPLARDAFGDVTSDLWRSRLQSGRIACSPDHVDFPSLLAEAMDVIAVSGHDPKKAALRLSCSASQLIKFVKDHPPAFEHWNKSRDELGLHPLK